MAMAEQGFGGRSVVVTGSGRGIGAEYVREFARRGGSVVVNDIHRESADALVAEVRAAGGTAVASYDSVGELDGANALVAKAVDEFGRIDVVINNAPWTPSNLPFEEISPEELDGNIEIHFKGAFWVAQAAYRHMKEQRYGRIVNTSSQAGAFGIWGLTAYGAAKMAQIGLTSVLALEGEEHNILVNAILPGARSTWRPLNAPKAELEALAKQNLNPVFTKRQTGEWVVPLTLYLSSEANTRTHRYYSALSGWFSEVFIGQTRGWVAPDEDPPSLEELGAHLDEIEAVEGYRVPRARGDETAFRRDRIDEAFPYQP
jgi:NAD(P)-dependent dehydrogenase (short-subunit alcohol dehydrogenase family)